MKILADATLPNLSTLFAAPFRLTLYNAPSELPDLLPTHDILLCRSTLKVTAQLLAGSQIQCVATASSGIDHIDSTYLKNNGVALFDAKGCNANAVADYVVATLAFLYRQGLIIGNKAGVIGVGKVGGQVVTRLRSMGFNVICYDPLRAQLDTFYSYCSLTELITCDVLCVHANLHSSPPYPSANLITTDFLAQLRPGTSIINAARGGIINEEDLLKLEKSITYCTDVYHHEPKINPKIIDFSTLCTPHIAGHSIEAKNDAVLKVSQQLHRYYGLPAPTEVPTSPMHSPLLANNETNSLSWQEFVLSLYNPLIDTQILKEADDKSHAFLSQRQAHQNRHDFVLYDTKTFDLRIKSLLGH